MMIYKNMTKSNLQQYSPDARVHSISASVHQPISTLTYWLIFALANWLIFSSCDETETYFQTLADLPQLDLSAGRAYDASYGTGDTLFMYGKFQQPQNPLTVTVGETVAEIVKNEKYVYNQSFGEDTLDRIGILIVEEMGLGKNRPVTLKSGEKEIICPSIEITAASASLKPYLAQRLKLTEIHSPASEPVLLHLNNGKGSMYYFDTETQAFNKISAGGVETVTDMGSIRLALGSEKFQVHTLYAGAVDPQEENLYFSVRARTGTNYRSYFIRYHIPDKTVALLNLKPNAGVRPSGAFQNGDILGELRFTVNEVQADSKGNVLIGIGSENAAQAVVTVGRAYFNSTQNILTYLHNTDLFTGGVNPLPGKQSDDAKNAVINLEEGLFYTAAFNAKTIKQYNLFKGNSLEEYRSATQDAKTIGFFGEVTLPSWMRDANSGNSISLLTLPGKKIFISLNTLLDFDAERLIRYAPSVDTSGYESSNERYDFHALNYDEEGNIYLYYKPGKQFVKTQIAESASN